MKRIICTLVAVAALAVTFIGCTTATQGRITANVVYAVYQKIAAKEGSTIAARIQAVWIKLDAIESFDELPQVYNETIAEVNLLIESVKSPIVKHVLKKVKLSLNELVTASITKTISNEAAQEYLIAFRDELRVKFGAIERCRSLDDPFQGEF